MKISIDTNAYCKMMENHQPLIECIENADLVFVSSTVLGELYAGFYLGKKQEDNLVELNTFLSLPDVSVIDVNNDIAQHYGFIVKQLRRQGTPNGEFIKPSLKSAVIWTPALVLRHASRCSSAASQKIDRKKRQSGKERPDSSPDVLVSLCFRSFPAFLTHH